MKFSFRSGGERTAKIGRSHGGDSFQAKGLVGGGADARARASEKAKEEEKKRKDEQVRADASDAARKGPSLPPGSNRGDETSGSAQVDNEKRDENSKGSKKKGKEKESPQKTDKKPPKKGKAPEEKPQEQGKKPGGKEQPKGKDPEGNGSEGKGKSPGDDGIYEQKEKPDPRKKDPGYNDRKKKPLPVDPDEIEVIEPPEEPPENVFGYEEPVRGCFEGVVYPISPRSRRLPRDYSSLEPVSVVYACEWDIPTRDWSQGFPGVEERFEWFSIRYSGSFFVEEAGTYKFRLSSDDGAKLMIDGKVVINNDGVHPPREASGEVQLDKGDHELVLLYFQGPRFHINLQLFATSPGGKEGIFSVR